MSPNPAEPLLPQESLGKLQRDWALEKEEWATVHSLRRVSNVENLSEEEQANVILETKQEFVDTQMKQWLAKRILNGQFVPEDNEDIASQWKRCWAQINTERVQRSYHPSSTIMTCCYCGRTCDKVLQRGTKVNLPVQPDCPTNTAHHLGWELVRGTFEDSSRQITYSCYSSTLSHLALSLTIGSFPKLSVTFALKTNGIHRIRFS